MASSDCFTMDGEVTSVLKGGKFKVKLENGYEITCTVCGKMRMNNIRVVVGDNVTVELNPYSLDNGRIMYRSK